MRCFTSLSIYKSIVNQVCKLTSNLYFPGDATTTICHRYTPPEQLSVFTKNADIIVVATGIPGLIKGHMIKEGCAVIDVGINRIKDEATGKMRLVGDCDFESKISYWF